ncbi:MAG TPA: hypothetical protein VEG61_04805 [Candidatus Dormibacteraeota bacterium]|nr:hypothetical protein [Candidatus Dormibacteraeota bacterium]
MKHETILAFVAFTLILLSTPISAGAAPVLGTDQPLYTIRDKQVTLTGSGLSPGQTYYVWVKGPVDNKTRYTGTSFLPVSGGLVPPDIAYPLNPNATLGTYILSLSTSSTVDNAQAVAHFGVWGTAQPVYQRTETVNILGGGIFPSTGLRLTIRDPAGNIVDQTTMASTAYGDFNQTWRIPKDAITDVFTAFIDGTGVFDNAQEDFVSQAKFTVTQAVLSLRVYQEPNSTYQRTQNAALSIVLQYPDGSPVTSSAPNIQPAMLLQNQVTAAFANLTLVDSANGVWLAESKILANATPSAKYRFEIPSMSFDDGYGNKGGAVDTYSNFFSVTNASLSITSQLNGTNIQIPFGQVSIISRVTYPDGSPLTAGTVTVVVTAGSSSSQLQSTYDPTMGEWRSSYSSTLFDLAHVGTWTLKVTAHDSYGNSGKATYDVTAQPYLFIALLASVLAALLVVRWSVSRYGRRVYFRVRKFLRSPRYRPRG